jgi:competence ComEA-like helix-hairpin-helix protein
MRFPFFKSPKVETKLEPKQPVRTSIPMRRSSLADTQPLQRLPDLPGAAAPSALPIPADGGPNVSLGLGSVVHQLPHQLFTEAGRSQLGSVTLSVPVGLVLGQLSAGKVSIKLDDLIPLFPANLLRDPLPPISDQQRVVLPLHEVIAAIPPELLTIQHDSEISADDPELEKLPKLIDDALLNPMPVETPEPVAEAPKATAEPERAERQKHPSRDASSPLVVPPRPKTTDAPEYVMVSLRALVAVMPDEVFCCPRTQLPTKVNLDSPVLLPTEPIIPQLRAATVRLPLSIIIAMVPHQVLASPMPPLDGQMIPIPLAEIIPQLPKSVFTDYLREPLQESEPATDEIPDPFQEKSALTEPSAPVAETPVESAATPATEPLAGELAVDEAALGNDSFSIFAERTAAPPTPEAQPEPVAEPVAEAATPVGQPAATEPVVEETPVEEPVSEPVAEAAPTTPELAPQPIVEAQADVPTPVEEPVAATPMPEPQPEPVAEPVAEAPEPAEEPVVEPVAEMPAAAPEPQTVEPVAEEIPAVETKPESAAASVEPTVELPVVAPEPAAAESVAAESEMVGEEEAAAEMTAFDEKKLLVDLNRCSVEDLMSIDGVGRALAQRIIDFRNSRGKFTSVDELRHVPGIGRKTFRALAGLQPRALNRLLGAPHDGELTLQEIVRLASKLPGIEGCMLATSDGLFLTGELPPHLDESTISVFAPQLFKKVGRYARELKVGSIRRFTIFTDTQPISIFRAADVYLIVIHEPHRFSKLLLKRCERISHEIARLSTQRVTV